MPFLMSDVSAGSQAALQLQQNVAAAPYVQEKAQLQAEADRLKVQQDKATLDKTKLQNLVAESGLKITEDTRASLEAVRKTPEFQAALDKGDYASILRMTGAAQMQAGDVATGANTLAQSEVFDAKKVAADQKKLDTQAQIIGNAYGVLEAIPDDKVSEFVDRLPKEIGRAHV